MNNRGQSLAMFILILPMIVLFIAYMVDLSIVSLEQNKVKNTIKDNMEVIVNKNIRDKEKIINVLKNNNKDLNVTVNINGDDISIKTVLINKRIFKIFDKNSDEIKYNYCASYINKIIKEC